MRSLGTARHDPQKLRVVRSAMGGATQILLTDLVSPLRES